ncbi:MAG: phage scaffolding protein [Paraclostridium sp.]
MEFTNEQIEFMKSEEGQALLNTNGVVTKVTDVDSLVETEEGLTNILKNSKISAELDRRNSKSFERFKNETLANYVEKTKLEEIELDFKNKINETKVNAEVDKVFANVKHAELLKAQIDRASIKVTDNGVEGLEEQLTKLKEKYVDLFEIAPSKKLTPPAPKNEIPAGLTKADFAKMSIAQKTKLYLEDKETYDKLTEV